MAQSSHSVRRRHAPSENRVTQIQLLKFATPGRKFEKRVTRERPLPVASKGQPPHVRPERARRNPAADQALVCLVQEGEALHFAWRQARHNGLLDVCSFDKAQQRHETTRTKAWRPVLALD